MSDTEVRKPPQVQSISPTEGDEAGGDIVTLFGSGLINTTSVTFGGAAATLDPVTDDNAITAASPPGVAGAVDITVDGSGGSYTLPQAFTYVVGEPAIPPPELPYTSVYFNGSAWTAAGEVPGAIAPGDLLGSDIELSVNGEPLTFTVYAVHATFYDAPDQWQANQKVGSPYPPPITRAEQP